MQSYCTNRDHTYGNDKRMTDEPGIKFIIRGRECRVYVALVKIGALERAHASQNYHKRLRQKKRAGTHSFAQCDFRRSLVRSILFVEQGKTDHLGESVEANALNNRMNKEKFCVAN